MSNQWREEQNRCQREIDRHRSAEQSYMDEGVQILELARNAPRLFERQEPRQKRRLLNFVLSNLADETVNGEPVSASGFPANREFNREFFKFGPFSAILASNQRANSNACIKIP
jgi:hypothetical protein